MVSLSIPNNSECQRKALVEMHLDVRGGGPVSSIVCSTSTETFRLQYNQIDYYYCC
jgi:hypothetical protein